MNIKRPIHLLLLLLIFTTTLSHAQTAPSEKVDLSKALHFVYYYDGYLHIELGEPNSLPEETLSKLYKILEENDYNYSKSDIDKHTKSIISENGYTLGRKLKIYLPASREYSETNLKSYGLTPSGDGGIAGISGNFPLQPGMRHHLQLTESEITPIGIGWWLDSGIPTDSIKASSFRLGPADKDQLNQLTQKSPDSTIHSASCATTANGKICAVLTEYQLPKKYRKAQFYKNTNGVWESVKEDIAYDGDLQVIHDYEGEHDGTQYDGEFYFLPDLDQDGYPELFFQNTVSSIGSITTEKDTDTLKIITLKHIYRGP